METQFVRIEVSEASDSFWDWKEWCGCEVEEFNEVFVMTGNPNWFSLTNASWYNRTLNLIERINCDIDGGCDEYDSEYIDCEEKLYYKLYDEVKDGKVGNSLEGIHYVAELLYPEWEFDLGTIHGYSQSDWQDVLYRKDKGNIQMLENAYFERMFRIWCRELEKSYYISHEEYWRAEMHENGIEKLLREKLDIDDEYEVEIFKCRVVDGYETWDQIN